MNIAQLNAMGSNQEQKTKETIEKFVRLFESNELPTYVKKAYIETAGKPCDRWSIGNKILMFVQDTSDARTFHDWNSIGRYIKKGSKAIYILQPYEKTITIDKKYKTIYAGKEVEGTENDETIQIKIMRFRASPRFRVEDTYGKALEEYKPKMLPPLLEVAKAWNIKVKYESTTIGEFGSTDTKDFINLCTESPDTFLHELSHIADKKIMGDKFIHGKQDPTQEMVAQLSACVLCDMYGIDATNYTWHYISSYAETTKPETIAKNCMKILDRVSKVVNMILDTQKQTIEVKAN